MEKTDCKHARVIIAKRWLYEFDVDTDDLDKEGCISDEVQADVEVCVHYCLDCQTVVDAWIEDVNGITPPALLHVE